jgi:hypothetical protein
MTQLQTFHLPADPNSDLQLASDMIKAWQADGIFQIATTLSSP